MEQCKLPPYGRLSFDSLAKRSFLAPMSLQLANDHTLRKGNRSKPLRAARGGSAATHSSPLLPGEIVGVHVMRSWARITRLRVSCERRVRLPSQSNSLTRRSSASRACYTAITIRPPPRRLTRRRRVARLHWCRDRVREPIAGNSRRPWPRLPDEGREPPATELDCAGRRDEGRSKTRRPQNTLPPSIQQLRR